ncbi:uncharacterized protein [Chelonus insularis]|uniref:uncharacterized protein n=1 Tax=Chelonus insularis TaxID=460826 RepID=UPI00158F50B8|nr:uncharacterized protein LOC118068989 [Chelonus insularis]
MSECIGQHKFVSSMTGSTKTGPLQPHQEEPVSEPDASPVYKKSSSTEHRMRQKMTPVPQQAEQPIQLTPLWEHVVRTQQFPPDVDTCLVFNEILARLRDPEWEVRQHAMRVLVDVLPTLDVEDVDELMDPVVIELINNLGHVAPAVRKGALDTLRVYLSCSQNRDNIIQTILARGLNSEDVTNSCQSNIALGVILSAPSLLFPSSSNRFQPSKQSLRMVLIVLTNHLVQSSLQEAVLKSLIKIRDIIGIKEFDSYLSECHPNAKQDFEALCKIHNISFTPKKTKKVKKSSKKKLKKENLNEGESQSCQNMGEVAMVNDDNLTIPPSRIVLETEIKLNQETAITMTILEEKDENSEMDSADELNLAKVKELNDEERDRIMELDNEPQDVWIERRKTPRRVHFGGEIIKLRTPDSDDSEIIQVQVPQTKIPLPVSPVTKMPLYRPGKSQSHPCSPNLPRRHIPKRSRSVSNSPKREIYVYDGSLNPKKGILMKTSSTFVNQTIHQSPNDIDDVFGMSENDRSWAFEVFEEVDENLLKKEQNLFVEKSKKKTKRSTKVHSSSGLGHKREKVQAQGECNKLDESQEKFNEIHFTKTPKIKDTPSNSNGESSDMLNDVKKHPDKNIDTSRLESAKSEKNVKNLEKKLHNDYSKTDEVEREKGKSLNVENKSSRKLEDKTRSPRKVFETFPRQERNYILMELSSPVKSNSRSREVSPEGIQSRENSQELKTLSDPSSIELNVPSFLNETLKIKQIAPVQEIQSTSLEIKDEVSKGIKDESNETDLTETINNPDNYENNEKTYRSNDTESKLQESNWEELGIVDQEVLNDLHNKEDWRARVRGLERVASALRTSSALIRIEPRLGSLLNAVLGCERSCRVAAAGMAVARVVVAGVSEEALKLRLPQLAWGLARQGGPNAAQLARIAMLRLRPALFLEQLLQPYCINAENAKAKTRENALQLLIFSLVTFPSTEFKVENVANKVALMVGDRKRRVRQAALDTLAVLAQIYEPEEVLQAGQRAAKELKEGPEMVAAIKTRLARKSLPLVSADGLVVYGLQISPTIQIAAGPDVDWIVAGSGSVSPGTGRPRGQIIPMNQYQARLNKSANKKSETRKISSSEINVAATAAWQLLSPPYKDETNPSDSKIHENNQNSLSTSTGNLSFYRKTFSDGDLSIKSYSKLPEIQSDFKLRLKNNLTPYLNPLDNFGDAYGSDVVNLSLLQNDKDVIMKQRKTEENFHRRMDEIYAERPHNTFRIESRIPIAQFGDRNIVVRHSTAYQRRRRLINDEEKYQTSASAPQTASGPRDESINRRYMSDRIKQESRPGSNSWNENLPSPISPFRNLSTPNHNYRKKSIIQTTIVKPKELFPSRPDSRSRTISNSSTIFRAEFMSPYINTEEEEEEEQVNEQNQRNSGQFNNQINDLEERISPFIGRDRESYDVSSDSSNERDNELRVQEVNEESRKDSSAEKSFDVITNKSNPSRSNSIEQISANVLSSATNSTDLEKETSSEDVPSSREIDSDDSRTHNPPSGSSAASNESGSIDEALNKVATPRQTGGIQAIAFDDRDEPDISLAFDRDYSTELKINIESRASINAESETFSNPPEFLEDQEEEFQDEEKNEESNHEAMNTVSIVVAAHSRPHSRAVAEYHEATFQPLDIRQSPEETSASCAIIHDPNPPSARSSDHEDISFTSEIVSEIHQNDKQFGDTEIHVVTVQQISRAPSRASKHEAEVEIAETHIEANGIATPKKQPSKLPRSRVKVKTGFNKITPLQPNYVEKTLGKSKPILSQCFIQLESNDWEVTMKGLKTLSSIARQQPEQLDTCPPSIVGRLLGRHIRNLRSQVARTACIAAADVFESQARSVEQDLDDIASPLLHRTADTNRFLRADSNIALDRMIEHLPPQRTIMVIVNRGASHQNAIVRAATARLLDSIVDRIGPNQAMSLPRDVREKLFNSGAKLLMDGNLDARNHAKKMFKKLSTCEGFRKALKDSVPETTLRHIDKTLKTL